MARIRLQKESVEDSKVRGILDQIKEKTKNGVPAAYRAFALHPHILQAN